MNHQRLQHIDTLRGLAMVWMTVFHFCFDLNNAGILQQDFHHNPLWTWQRTGILSLFLLCAGAGQAIADYRGQGRLLFWRRWGQIVAAAGLVSLGSWLMFPRSYIYFGVLHGMAVMLLLTRLLVRQGWWSIICGTLFIAMHLIAGASISVWASNAFGLDFNAPALNWIGLITRLPFTEDYVPLVPWLGVMLAGGGATRIFITARIVNPQSGRQGRIQHGLAWLGRHSLSYYLLHQPVLLGLLWLAGVRF